MNGSTWVISITSQETTTTIDYNQEKTQEEKTMTATAYICYDDGTPSEAQTFTDKDGLVKALTDALDMFDSHESGSTDAEVKEFHCTFIRPKYKKLENSVWDKFDERSYKKDKEMKKYVTKDKYEFPKSLMNPCSFKMDCGKCNKKCDKNRYYDKSMDDYCEHDFEV